MNEIDFRPQLGAYVCGLLDEDEQRAVAVHLTSCGECRREVADLIDVTRRLDRLKGDADVTEPGSSGIDGMNFDQLEAEGAQLENDLILPRTLAALRSQRAHTRRRRVLGVAAAAAVLVVGGGIAGGEVNSHRHVASAEIAAGPGSQTRTAHDLVSGVSIVATLTPEHGFSRVNALVADEPGNAHCELIAVSRSGEQQVVSSWAVAPGGSGSRGTQVEGSAAIPLSDVGQLQVRTLFGTHIVTVVI